MWMPEIAKAEVAAEHFVWNFWHMSSIDQQIMSKAWMASALPITQGHRHYWKELYIDVTILHITYMDDHGNFSFVSQSLFTKVKAIIAEVVKNQSRGIPLIINEINIT